MPIVRSQVTETTALGAAYLAGLAVGFWKDKNELAEAWKVDKIFEPVMPESEATALRERWSEAVKRSRKLGK